MVHESGAKWCGGYAGKSIEVDGGEAVYSRSGVFVLLHFEAIGIEGTPAREPVGIEKANVNLGLFAGNHACQWDDRHGRGFWESLRSSARNLAFLMGPCNKRPDSK